MSLPSRFGAPRLTSEQLDAIEAAWNKAESVQISNLVGLPEIDEPLKVVQAVPLLLRHIRNEGQMRHRRWPWILGIVAADFLCLASFLLGESFTVIACFAMHWTFELLREERV